MSLLTSPIEYEFIADLIETLNIIAYTYKVLERRIITDFRWSFLHSQLAKFFI